VCLVLCHRVVKFAVVRWGKPQPLSPCCFVCYFTSCGLFVWFVPGTRFPRPFAKDAAFVVLKKVRRANFRECLDLLHCGYRERHASDSRGAWV